MKYLTKKIPLKFGATIGPNSHVHGNGLGNFCIFFIDISGTNINLILIVQCFCLNKSMIYTKMTQPCTSKNNSLWMKVWITASIKITFTLVFFWAGKGVGVVGLGLVWGGVLSVNEVYIKDLKKKKEKRNRHLKWLQETTYCHRYSSGNDNKTL